MPTSLSNPTVLPDFIGAPEAREGYAGKCSKCGTDACGPRAGELVFLIADIDHEGPVVVGGRCLKEMLDLPDAVTGEAWAAEREQLEAVNATLTKDSIRVITQRDALTEVIAGLNAEIEKAQSEAADAYARGFEDGVLEATASDPEASSDEEPFTGPEPESAA